MSKLNFTTTKNILNNLKQIFEKTRRFITVDKPRQDLYCYIDKIVTMPYGCEMPLNLLDKSTKNKKVITKDVIT